MSVKLLTEHHLGCLSLKRGCRGSSESTHVKMPHCWKSHALAHLFFLNWEKVCAQCSCYIEYMVLTDIHLFLITSSIFSRSSGTVLSRPFIKSLAGSNIYRI